MVEGSRWKHKIFTISLIKDSNGSVIKDSNGSRVYSFKGITNAGMAFFASLFKSPLGSPFPKFSK